MSDFAHLSPDQQLLAKAVHKYFKNKYRGVAIKVEAAIHADLQWRPILFLKKNGHEIIACELAEQKIYPLIFKHIHSKLIEIPVVVHCYSVCPEQLYLDAQSQKDFGELKHDGHGLLSVNTNGSVTERAHSTPAVLHISAPQLKPLLVGFSSSDRNRVVNASDIYAGDPLSGVRELCDFVEQSINSAAASTNRKFALTIKAADTIHNKCQALLRAGQLRAAYSSIGAIMGYYSAVRNSANHAARSSKEAHTKCTLCRENFINGIRYIKEFKRQIKLLGVKA